MDERLVLEYKTLNEAVSKRGSDTVLVESIMIPASTLVLATMIENIEKLGKSTIIPWLKIPVIMPIISLVIILVPLTIRYTTNRLDEVQQGRIRCIEKQLGIYAHRYTYNKIKCQTWYKIRKRIIYCFYLALIMIYIGAIMWTWTHEF